MSNPDVLHDDEARREREDTEAILDRRRFLIQSALAGAGIAAAGAAAQAQLPPGQQPPTPDPRPCLSVVPPQSRPCLKVLPPPPAEDLPPVNDAFGDTATVTEAFSPRTTFLGHSSPVVGLAISPDGVTLAAISRNGTIRLWESGTGRRLGGMSLQSPGETATVSFSPDGKTLAANGKQSILLWDVQTRQNTATIDDGELRSAIFSPSGRSIASSGADGNVSLWDPATHNVRTPFLGHTAEVSGLAFSPDGKSLASASADKTVRLWDALSGETRHVLSHQGPVLAVAFSPDGKCLASGGGPDQAAQIKLWNVETGRELAILKGHAKKVLGVAFSRDGKTLASCGEDGSVRLWSVATRRPLAVIRGHQGRVNCVEFSRGGKTLFSAGADQKVRAWDIKKWILREREPEAPPPEGPQVCLSVRPGRPTPCLSVRPRDEAKPDPSRP